LFAPLCVGGAVRIVANALDLAREVVDVTLINTAPTAMTALVEGRNVPATARVVNLAGEPLKKALVEYIFETTGVEEVCNLYGPTETTTYSTWVAISRGETFAGHIGRPIANTRVYILDGYGNPVPVGVKGEIYIGGEGIARGYLSRAELTAERFLPDPFTQRPGARLYKTGDLARHLENGDLEYLGRIDNQVKIRGFRIEPGEIEARIAERPEVREVVVLARDEGEAGKRLVAYYTGEEIDVEELRARLSSALPEYMIPSSYVHLESWPLTPNGKLDRRALPSPEWTLEENYAAPRTTTEELMVGIWAEALGVDRVGIYDNFFALGGHSLIAGRLIARMRDVFRREVPLRRLFESPTVEGLSRWVDLRQLDGEDRHVEFIGRMTRHDTAPLSLNQEAVLLREWWARMLLLPINPYHIVRAFSLKGQLDPSALEQALQEIIRRHEVLRMSYYGMDKRVTVSQLPAVLAGLHKAAYHNGKYHNSTLSQPQSWFSQSVHADASLKLKVVDLEAHDEQERQAEITRLIKEESERPFDYEAPPLMRAALVRKNSAEHLLVLVLHHMVGDEWSLGVLERELWIFYQSFVNKSPLSLSSLPIQYSDFAVWERNQLQGKTLQNLIMFWKERWIRYPLIDIQELSFAHAEKDASRCGSGKESVLLDGELFAGVKKLARQRGVTIYMALLAALQTLLHLYTGKERIGVWGSFANRTRSELEPLIGFFANAHLLGMEVTPDSRVADLLEQSRDVVLESSHHQALANGLQWSAVLEGLGGHNGRPNFYEGSNILIGLVNTSSTPPLGGLVIESFPIDHIHTPELPLRVLAFVSDSSLKIAIRYLPLRFDSHDIRAVLADLRHVLGQFVAFPQALVRDLTTLRSGKDRAPKFP
jgi:hypothetical protein